jgi:hypothetical protein
MALISCRECGKPVSTEASACPHCGTPQTCGYPERFAQEALGHNSIAVHRAYAKRAKMKLPSLGEYEKKNVAPPAAAKQ